LKNSLWCCILLWIFGLRKNEKTNSNTTIEMKGYLLKSIKWYQAIIIGVLSGIIPPIFQLTSIKWGHIAIGLFILFFMYNILTENRKQLKK